jgi:hypothetical protein
MDVDLAKRLVLFTVAIVISFIAAAITSRDISGAWIVGMVLLLPVVYAWGRLIAPPLRGRRWLRWGVAFCSQLYLASVVLLLVYGGVRYILGVGLEDDVPEVFFGVGAVILFVTMGVLTTWSGGLALYRYFRDAEKDLD